MISEIRTVTDISIVHLHGDLGIREMNHVTKVLKSLMERNRNNVVLDFENVEHVDYKTLVSLVAARFSMDENEGNLKLANLNNYIRKIFYLVGFLDCFEIYDSLPEAILSFEDRAFTLSCPS